MLRPPVISWTPSRTSQLPDVACRTLIVHEVDRLTIAQQTTLSVLLTGAANDLQIVSLARRSVFPLVDAGLFLETLYYHLNVVLLELGKP